MFAASHSSACHVSASRIICLNPIRLTSVNLPLRDKLKNGADLYKFALDAGLTNASRPRRSQPERNGLLPLGRYRVSYRLSRIVKRKGGSFLARAAPLAKRQ